MFFEIFFFPIISLIIFIHEIFSSKTLKGDKYNKKGRDNKNNNIDLKSSIVHVLHSLFEKIVRHHTSEPKCQQ